jgi:hypothetical protein
MLMKNGDAHDRVIVQFSGLLSFDVRLNGGWRAGATVMVYGGTPFFGTREISVHWFMNPNLENGPPSTAAFTSRAGGFGSGAQSAVVVELITVNVA